MNTLITKKLTDAVQDMFPNIWKACYPRHIVPPTGYLNPKVYAASLSANATLWGRPEMDMTPHTTNCLVAMLLTDLKVPTYFVQRDFAHAVANTKLPADFQLSELKWPLDAMLFVLPNDFVRSYFKFCTPFLSICRCLKGFYPTQTQYARAKNTGWEIESYTPAYNASDRLLFHAPMYFESTFPCDYNGTYPLHLDLNSVLNSGTVDATEYEATLHDTNYDAPVDAPTPEQEKELTSKLNVFAIKLLLAFTARPHLIKNGTIQRPQRIKHAKVVQSELWNPNLVGWDYVTNRKGSSLGGSHASPRMHYRVGHFTQQFIGKRGDPDFVPSSALPRKEDGSISWETLDPSVKTSFNKNHKLTWLEPVLVDTSANEKD